MLGHLEGKAVTQTAILLGVHKWMWIHRRVCHGRAGSAGSRRTFHHPFLPRSSDNIAALNPLWSAEEAPTVLPKEHIK